MKARMSQFLKRRTFAICIIAILMGSCASTRPSGPSPTLQPFSTDVCSLFPDQAFFPFGHADFSICCIVHDLAYWRGGLKESRLAADQELRTCIQKTTGSCVLAFGMYGSVQLFGGPYLPTSFRWGYGWPFGRKYVPLSAEEETTAHLLQKQYLDSVPSHPPS